MDDLIGRDLLALTYPAVSWMAIPDVVEERLPVLIDLDAHPDLVLTRGGKHVVELVQTVRIDLRQREQVIILEVRQLPVDRLAILRPRLNRKALDRGHVVDAVSGNVLRVAEVHPRGFD